MRVHRRGQAGSSLIEVLIAMLIGAMALLGILGLQTRTADWQRDAFDRRSVARLADQLTERMRANHLGFVGGLYTGLLGAGDSPPPAPSCASSVCTPAEAAARDMAAWFDEVRRVVPVSVASISRDSNMLTTVALAWSEPSSAAVPNEVGCENVVPAANGWRCFVVRIFP